MIAAGRRLISISESRTSRPFFVSLLSSAFIRSGAAVTPTLASALRQDTRTSIRSSPSPSTRLVTYAPDTLGSICASALAAPTFTLEDADAALAFPASDTLIALGFPLVGGADLLDPALGFQAFGPSPPPGVVVAFGALGLPPPLIGPGSVDIDALSFGTDPITLLTLGGPDNIVFSADRLSTGGFLFGVPCVGTFGGSELPTECGPFGIGSPPFSQSPGDLYLAPGVPPFAAFGPPGFGAQITDEDGIPTGAPAPNPFPPVPGLGLVDAVTSGGPSFLPDNLDSVEVDDISLLGAGPVYFSLDEFGTGLGPGTGTGGAAAAGFSGADVLLSVGGGVGLYVPAPILGLAAGRSLRPPGSRTPVPVLRGPFWIRLRTAIGKG